MESNRLLEKTINEQKMEQRRVAIDDAFLVTLFQILVDTPRMTATEALIRAQEKGMLLTPTMGRQQSEALGPQIERELDLLMFHRILPPIAILVPLVFTYSQLGLRDTRAGVILAHAAVNLPFAVLLLKSRASKFCSL